MTKLFRNVDWFWIPYIAGLLWLWRPLWAESQIPAFRDGFHFYYPQFHWLDSCYQSGEYFPRWNPNEGLGASVWGQPTWQIFYPLRLLWLLPLGGLPQLSALWIIVHQIIATLGMKRLAFEIGLSRNAGWLVGVSFSLCCPVSFQYSNMIYLCSAAWIGWALIPMFRMLAMGLHNDELKMDSGEESRSFGRLSWQMAGLLCQFGTACSMMVLSGDPQSAVNAAFIGLACWAFSTFRSWKSRILRPTQSSVTHVGEAQRSSYSAKAASQISLVLRVVRKGIVKKGIVKKGIVKKGIVKKGIVKKGIVKKGIVKKSIVKEGMASKGRAVQGIHLLFVARALITLAIFLLLAFQVHASWKWFQVSSRCKQPTSVSDSVSPRLDAILADNSALTTHRVFEFRISPWELPTLVWPTIGGFYQPVHTRWVDSIEGVGRMWIPSLYMGVIVALMGIDRWRALLIGRAAGVRRPNEIFFFWISLFSFLAATGSLYSLITKVVPGYDSFRYPAKWIVWTCVGLSMSAAFQFDQWLKHQSHQLWRRLPRLVLGMVALGALTGLAFAAWRNADLQLAFSEWLHHSYDRMLGSADETQTVQVILFALHWPLVILCIFGIGLIVLPKRSHSTFLLLVCLMDLCVSGRHWITSTAEPNSNSPTITGRFSNACWCSIRRADIRKLRTSDVPNDQAAQIELQQRFLIGKLGLLTNTATFHASGSLKPWAVVKIERWLLQNDNFQESQNELDEVLSRLGVGRRLFESESGEIGWKDIESVKPLCEVVPSDAGPSGILESASNKSAQAAWKWISNSCLEVNLVTDRECRLIIRQFNDGGWRTDCQTIDRLSPMKGELFLLFRVPEGKHTMQISRRAIY